MAWSSEENVERGNRARSFTAMDSKEMHGVSGGRRQKSKKKSSRRSVESRGSFSSKSRVVRAHFVHNNTKWV